MSAISASPTTSGKACGETSGSRWILIGRSSGFRSRWKISPDNASPSTKTARMTSPKSFERRRHDLLAPLLHEMAGVLEDQRLRTAADDLAQLQHHRRSKH